MKMLIGLIICSSIMLISGANIQDKHLRMSGVTTSSNSSNLNTTQKNNSSTTSMPALSTNSTTLMANVSTTSVPVLSTNSTTLMPTLTTNSTTLRANSSTSPTPVSTTNSSAPSDSTVTQNSQFLFESHMKLEMTKTHTKPKEQKKLTYKKTRNSTIPADGVLKTKEHLEESEETIAEIEDKKESTIERKFNCSNGASIAVQFVGAFTYELHDNKSRENSSSSSEYIPSSSMTQVSGNCNGETKSINMTLIRNSSRSSFEFYFEKINDKNVHRLTGLNISGSSDAFKYFEMKIMIPNDQLITECKGVDETCRYDFDEQLTEIQDNIEKMVQLILKNFEFYITENKVQTKEDPITFIYPGHTASVGVGFLVLILFAVICFAVYKCGKYNGYKNVNKI